MRPLVPLLIAFIGGILSASATGSPPGRGLVIILFLASLAPLAIFRRRGRLLATLPFFFLGALFILPVLSPSESERQTRDIVSATPGRLLTTIDGVVSGGPEKKGGVSHIYLDIKGLSGPSGRREVRGGVRLTVKGEAGGIRKGDTLVTPAALSLPRNFSNPGGFDYEWWLKRKGVLVTGYVRDAGLITVTGKEGFALTGFIEGVREGVGRFIDELGLREGAVIKALVTGEKGDIDFATLEAFRRTGTAHILAISGLHVGIVALLSYLFILFLLKRSEKVLLHINARKAAVLLSLPPVFFYGAVAGFSVSTQRAVLMVSAFAVVFLLGRGRDLYNTIALAALLILISSPGALWEVSFQLSFAALVGIIYLVPRFEGLLKRANVDEFGRPAEKPGMGRRALTALGRMSLVSFAAVLATAPITAYYFNGVSLAGILLNLIVVPVVGFVAVPASLISILFITVWPALSAAVFELTDKLIYLVEFINLYASNFEWSFLRLSTPTVVEIVLFYLLLISLAEGLKRRRLLYAVPFIAALLIGLTPAYAYLAREGGERLEVTFLSVGQGDAAFIRFAGGKTMLIDGGGSFGQGLDMGRLVVGPYLRKRRIRRIDYMVLSHAQRDHMAGLGFIAENFEVGEFWWNGEGRLGALGKALRTREVSSVVMDSGSDSRVIGKTRLDFLHPGRADGAAETGLDINNNSLVIKFTRGEHAFLFTGDIGAEAEATLPLPDIRADLLKAPHHGSRYSSSQAFLAAVKPDYVIVSAGHNNRFGFPHTETLERYDAVEASFLRTERDGAVSALTDGRKLTVKSHLTGTFYRGIISK